MSELSCAVCGRDDVALFRGRPKGEIGPLYCRRHAALDPKAPPIDQEVEDIATLISGESKDE